MKKIFYQGIWGEVLAEGYTEYLVRFPECVRWISKRVNEEEYIPLFIRDQKSSSASV